MSSRFLLLLAALLLATSTRANGETFHLTRKETPADNPLKGLVPYASANVERFPHSLEFDYLKWSDLMIDFDDYDWSRMESRLDLIASRGCQAVFRVWIEYPDKPSGLPDFLRNAGVKSTTWINKKESPATKNATPDYDDERLVSALERFIREFGRRYDGDPRLGFITAGLLGAWGEWHTWPREELFASKETQKRVLAAYCDAFSKTPILLRYPAGDSNEHYVGNTNLPFGYHDDSFAWGTLKTKDPNDAWFFMSLLSKAGDSALDKWKTQPIGGEIRPEIWGQVFDVKPKHPKAQDFATCVEETHASWLLDSGMFEKSQSAERVENAKRQIQRMGYDYYIRSARIDRLEANNVEIEVEILNQGVAPFYYDWGMEIAFLADNGAVNNTLPVDWKIGTIEPNNRPHLLKASIQSSLIPVNARKLAVRVINPLKNGKQLKFANETQDADAPGWLTLGAMPN